MTAEKDPRIEAVAKLLFTGPLVGYWIGEWDNPQLFDSAEHRRNCLMAAEDVLRGIDETSVIGTEEVLEALPVGSVIRDGIGTLERMDHPEFMWRMMGGPDCAPHHGVTLPARLLWTPEPTT